MDRRVTGIFGGSFNPVHSGHMMLASYIAQFGPVDDVELVLSPDNPLKSGMEMAPESDRLAMLRLACAGSNVVNPNDIELTMPRPSYTIDTLSRLAAERPSHDFRLIIGSDNWCIFDKWKSAREIVERFGVIVYPRRGYPVVTDGSPRVTVVDAPMIDISSTFIRGKIADGADMNFFVPSGVYDYIKSRNLYSHIK